ncbi:hypothetical protein L9F63_012004, partial [Diploptera punctata]
SEDWLRMHIHRMQGSPIEADEPRGLPLVKILPQYLKDIGYINHIVGKWHLGFYKSKYTPTFRGFDSHLGYWTGSLSYYDHILQSVHDNGVILNGHDFRRNMTTAWDLDGQYATDVFTNEAVNIIFNHSKEKPLFLYMCHLAVHAGNMGKWLEAPQSEIDKFRHIPDPNRRTYAAMVSKMDESVGKVTSALQNKGMLENSIIVFISDNGAPSVGYFQNWGSNYPLRGMKATLWEGGVRGVALIWSLLIKHPHRVSNELIHVSDWLPTLFRAAGGNVSDLPANLDGKDQWDSIINNKKSVRTDLLLNINEVERTAAFRAGPWKLILGTYGKNGSYDTYLGVSGSETINPTYNTTAVTSSPAWQALSSLSSSTYKTLLQNKILNLRQQATVKCNYSEKPKTTCNPSQTNQPCLFNIVADPCEMHDMSVTNEATARELYGEMVKLKQTLISQINQPGDIIGANPAKFNNTWSPWYVEAREWIVNANVLTVLIVANTAAQTELIGACCGGSQTIYP